MQEKHEFRERRPVVAWPHLRSVTRVELHFR
jgi:hypothetical protein